jgi:1,4-alpha-glucan branching enzyme
MIRLSPHSSTSLPLPGGAPEGVLLGPHHEAPYTRLRVWQPEAHDVQLCDRSGNPLARLERQPSAPGLFEARIRGHITDYVLHITYLDGSHQRAEDPYRYQQLIPDHDAWLLNEGCHPRPYLWLGSHPGLAPCQSELMLSPQTGTRFLVHAPAACAVFLVGDHNHWQAAAQPMIALPGGLWGLFVPEVNPGNRYQYRLLDAHGNELPWRADPYAFAMDQDCAASVVCNLPLSRAGQNPTGGGQHAQPLSIYEVHLGSWQRGPGGRLLFWDELAEILPAHVHDLGFTHVEFMPVAEHPFGGSWGYQPLGLYAPTRRFGQADGLRRLIDAFHQRGIGVILDWVPAHFPGDSQGLACFDGQALFEHHEPLQARQPAWNTLSFDYRRPTVAAYLLGNARYWFERFGADGLRMDAVSSMLYRDYGRAAGEWNPNQHGGRENLEAIDFIRHMTRTLSHEFPGRLLIAEESSQWPGVTREEGSGLGFGYKWNLGWMNDTLDFMKLPPAQRGAHPELMTFGPYYAASEHFILPLSHDEVVHGKSPLLTKMPGSRHEQFANLRAYYAFMWAHPGKKLLFMGGEFAQDSEWCHDDSLDWGCLQHAEHSQMMTLVRELNRQYRQTPALWELDGQSQGFQWVDHHLARQGIIAFFRRSSAQGSWMLSISNFSDTYYPGFVLGLPCAGIWQEHLNTDASQYAGQGRGNLGLVNAVPLPYHGWPASASFCLPPCSTLWLTPSAPH